MSTTATFIAAIMILCLGVHTVLTRRNMIRICLGLTLMESAAILMVVALAWSPGVSAPIVADGIEAYADPLPHALALTAIVIGASITALALALTVQVQRSLGTVDIEEVRRRLS